MTLNPSVQRLSAPHHLKTADFTTDDFQLEYEKHKVFFLVC